MSITLEGKVYSWDQVESEGVLLADSQNELHYRKALLFCYQWLNDAQDFHFQTSGSTGKPKEIKATRMQMVASAEKTIQALDFHSTDSFLLCLGMNSIAASMMLVRAMTSIADITVVMPSSHPLADLDSEHSFTSVSFVPLQLHDLLTDPGLIKKVDRFKTVLVGGASLDMDLENILKKSQAGVYHTYGMTETLSHIALKRIGSDTSFHLLEGIDVKTDNRACLCVRGKVTHNEWLVTNDLIEFTSERSFRVMGRADEVINSGGIKIFPMKVENALKACLPGVELFVYGMPDKLTGQKVIAIIESTPINQKNLDEIKSALLKNLSKYELPKAFHFISPFHRTKSGKIDKHGTMSTLNI